MANVNSNDDGKNGCFSQYVNFDQFLMQHNIGNSSSILNNQQSHGNDYQPLDSNNFNLTSYNNNSQWNNGMYNNGFNQHQASVVENSNLVATASEFVPQTPNVLPWNSSLTANADEFIPKNQHKSTEESIKDVHNKKQISKSSNESTTNTEILANTLNNTHISSDSSLKLNATGGAIKKIRNQNQRNDSIERDTNGKSYHFYIINIFKYFPFLHTRNRCTW